MQPTSYALFIATDANYDLVLAGIEQEINRCAHHAVTLSAFTLELIQLLALINDPSQRELAALLLEKIEAIEDQKCAVRAQPPAPIQYWLHGMPGALAAVPQRAA